jgi:D-cysteine desulfhydrase family pyridoxal phosphate-dependent enzyme
MLDHLPRFPLATLPTPLDEAFRLREALGGRGRCPRILIKRDDLTGLAFGGNKVRKLEFLVGDALERGATTLITCGAAQSNHARATAAAAVKAGLRSFLVLYPSTQEHVPQGNLLLDQLMGAELQWIESGAGRDEAIRKAGDGARAAGEKPYEIPVGGSSPIGAAGYMTMTIELKSQLAAIGTEPNYLYFASGSGGTQAGITVAARLLEMPYEIRGILDSPDSPEFRKRMLNAAHGAAALVGSDLRLAPEDLDPIAGYYGEAYAAPTPEADAAILLLARTDAIFLDPVYSAKAMSGLIDHIRTGQVKPDETVVFVHTGGTPALFAAAQRLSGIAQAE